ncbi:MAG: hypothetical protein LC685_00555 [Actinobacteria bacterium]|nr:hypothetical protein [Actinomycetota bacterium]
MLKARVPLPLVLCVAVGAVGAVGAACSSGTSTGGAPAPPGTSARVTTSNRPSNLTGSAAEGASPSGGRPTPIVYRPANLSRTRKVPLVVALHASGGTPAGFEATSRWNQMASRHRFVVAYLGSAAPAWKYLSNVAYISREITRIERAQNIDHNRVYVTGFSAGAYISYFVGCKLSGQIAGIAPVSDGMVLRTCHLARPISELTIIGTQDILPLGGTGRFPSVYQVASLWRRLDRCPRRRPSTSRVGPTLQRVWAPCRDGSAVGLYILNGGHHVYPGAPTDAAMGPQFQSDASYDATRAIWAFFASHSPRRG